MRRVDAIDDGTLESFRWPSCRESDGSYSICRYLADFVLMDGDGNEMEDMLVERKEVGAGYVAQGTLLARPGSKAVSKLNFKVPFTSYCIDFSKLGSCNRGYWLESEIDGKRVYYKLGRPHPRYRKFFDVMEEKISKFLEFYDYLARDKNLNKGFLIECDMTLPELHIASNRAFDIEFVKQNFTFVIINLINTLNVENSIILIESMRILVNLDMKYVVSLFPTTSFKSYGRFLVKATSKIKLKNKMKE